MTFQDFRLHSQLNEIVRETPGVSGYYTGLAPEARRTKTARIEAGMLGYGGGTIAETRVGPYPTFRDAQKVLLESARAYSEKKRQDQPALAPAA